MTWTDNTVLTAAQMNTHLRDNLLETIVAKTSATSRMCVIDQRNKLVERNPGSDTINTNESTTSTEYTDLATFGPTIKRVTGPHCFVAWRSQIRPGALGPENDAGCVSVQISRTNAELDDDSGDGTVEATVEASDTWACRTKFNTTAQNSHQYSQVVMFHDLGGEDETEAFEYEFTLKYRAVTGNTDAVEFNNRHLFVWPFS